MLTPDPQWVFTVENGVDNHGGYQLVVAGRQRSLGAVVGRNVIQHPGLVEQDAVVVCRDYRYLLAFDLLDRSVIDRPQTDPFPAMQSLDV
jgi:hypothetical protein